MSNFIPVAGSPVKSSEKWQNWLVAGILTSHMEGHVSRETSKLKMAVDHASTTIKDSLSDLHTSVQNLSGLMDWRMSLMLEQQRLTNRSLNNIVELLRIPDVQKERQYHITQGLKHFKNAAKDTLFYKDALDNLLEAEKREKADYMALFHIGLIYLYSPTLLDLAKAEDYFRRAARYASVDQDADGERIASIFIDGDQRKLKDGDDSSSEQSDKDDEEDENDDASTDDSDSHDDDNEKDGDKKADTSTSHPPITTNSHITRFTAEAYFHTAVACYAQGKTDESLPLAKQATQLCPQFLEASFLYAKALAGCAQPALLTAILEDIIKKDCSYFVKTEDSDDLSRCQEVTKMLCRLRADACLSAQELLDACKAKCICSDAISKTEEALARQIYIDIVSYAKTLSYDLFCQHYLARIINYLFHTIYFHRANWWNAETGLANQFPSLHDAVPCNCTLYAVYEDESKYNDHCALCSDGVRVGYSAQTAISWHRILNTLKTDKGSVLPIFTMPAESATMFVTALIKHFKCCTILAPKELKGKPYVFADVIAVVSAWYNTLTTNHIDQAIDSLESELIIKRIAAQKNGAKDVIIHLESDAGCDREEPWCDQDKINLILKNILLRYDSFLEYSEDPHDDFLRDARQCKLKHSQQLGKCYFALRVLQDSDKDAKEKDTHDYLILYCCEHGMQIAQKGFMHAKYYEVPWTWFITNKIISTGINIGGKEYAIGLKHFNFSLAYVLPRIAAYLIDVDKQKLAAKQDVQNKTTVSSATSSDLQKPLAHTDLNNTTIETRTSDKKGTNIKAARKSHSCSAQDNPSKESKKTTSKMAVVSLILASLTPIGFGPFAAIPAFILALHARSQIKKSNGAIAGEGIAIAAMVICFTGIVLWSVIMWS